ncbi:MAG: FrgA protein [Archangiaceae bacterium]|nr:FrgA protein [Archangiaceae bacterium]
MPHRLAQHLISRGLLPAPRVDEALKRLASTEGVCIDSVLLEQGIISEAGVLQAMADVSGVRLVNLSDFEPNKGAATELPLKIAQRLNVVPLSVEGNTLHLAVGYPVPHAQLKEVGFLLGKPLELWVSIEARRRDWLAQLYQVPLPSRFAALLAAVDPSRRPAAAASGPSEEAAESLSEEVLERIAQGIVEEPVLLSAKKKRGGDDEPVPASALGAPKKKLAAEPEILEAEEVEPEEATSVIDTDAYQAYVKSSSEELEPENETSVVDLNKYSEFAREASRPGGTVPPPDRLKTDPDLRAVKIPGIAPVAPTDVSFPGGVLPPPSAPRGAKTGKPPAPAGREAEPEWLTSAPAARPGRDPVKLDAAPTAPAPPSPQRELRRLQERVPDTTPIPGRISRGGVGTVPFGSSDSEPTTIEKREKPTVPGRPAVAAPTAPHPAVNGVGHVPPGMTTEWSLAQARAALKAASHDREALLDVVLTFGRRVFDFVAGFAVLRGAAHGWDARGEGDAAAIRQITIPLDAASVFRTVSLTRGSYVGPLPPDALSQHYLALLGRAPRTVFLWPVEVKSRLVAVFYGDCAHRPMSQRKLSDFILFCQDLPGAFSELILHRKQRAPFQPEQSGEIPPPSVDDAPPAQPTDADWFQGLLTLLTGPDPNERLTAMAELLRTPDDSARMLVRAFPGPTGWSRLPVVERPEADELGPIPGALARLGQSAAGALAPLLDSDDSDARYLALLTAGSLPYPEVVDGVLRGLFDLEPDISSAARAAATALKGQSHFVSSMKGLRQELTARDPLRRSLAARALGVLHDRDAIEGLINLAGSDDALCAQSAAEALKEITRASFGTQQRQWTSWWAQAREKRRVEWLVDALESADFDSRLSSIDELTRTLGDNLGYLADGPEGERGAAVHRWREYLADQPQLEV